MDTASSGPPWAPGRIKRLRATAGQGPNYVGPSLGYVGLGWLSLELGSCCPMWRQKIRKMGTGKKHCKTQDILMVGGLCWPILRAMWAHLGALSAHLGAMLAHLGAMLAHLGGYVAPCWGYVGPS